MKNFIVPSIPLAVLLVVVCILVWLSDYLGVYFNLPIVHQTDSVNNLVTVLGGNDIVPNSISLIITLLNAFLIAQINNRFTIIRTRTFLPIFIFLLLMSCWYPTHTALTSQISLTLFIFAVFNFFNMLRDNKASEQAFLGSLLISVSSLLINQFIFLIPVCWFGFIIFQSLSLRTFIASVLGSLAPWVLYLSTLYLLNPSENLFRLFSTNLNYDFNFTTFTLYQYIYTSSMAIILIISIFGLSYMSKSDAIHTRNKLNFLMFLLVSLAILSVIFINQFVYFLPLIAFIYALLFSHPLTLSQNNFYGILFTVFCTLNLAFFVFKYISL
ncbi:MAG: DUF6427 family protein [Paludibacter sp.]